MPSHVLLGLFVVGVVVTGVVVGHVAADYLDKQGR